MPGRSDLTVYRRLLRLGRPYRLHLASIIGLGLLAPPLSLLTPLPLKIAVDSVIGSEPLPAFLTPLVPTAWLASKAGMLAVLIALVLIVALLIHVQALAQWLLQSYTGERLVLGFRAELFRHLQRLSLAYHDARGTADPLYRIQYDAPSIQWVLVTGIPPFVTAVTTLLAMVYVTARIDTELAAVALTIAPVLLVLMRLSAKRLRTRWTQVKELQSSAMAVVQEVLGALRVVKAFAQEDREQRRFIAHAARSVWGELRLALIEGGFDLLVGLTVAAGTAAALFIGVRHVQTGTLTLGNLLLVMSYLAQLYAPLQTMSRKVAELQGALAGAERVFALLDEVPDVPEAAHPRPCPRATGAVAFRQVSFGYEPGRLVLTDVSFAVPAGARVGITGSTGSGKTTLLSLLMRFYDPVAGDIRLDGIDLREYRLADLRNQFAVVLQEPVLFSTSIAENIAYARPDATQAAVEAAARQANAHDFVRQLPDGYDTQVGERGLRLSGGERQRISLARAFLKDAPVLIMDEPTSAVDLRTEAAIMDAMERLMRGRTTFIITHRPSIVDGADMVLSIEQARVRMQDAGSGRR
jgi:ATP-binding cassette subfamily B protein